MTEIEHSVLGAAFAVCAGLFFLGAVPLYVWRHVGPGKPPPLPTGNVRIAGFGLADVIGVSMFFGFYALAWMGQKAGEEAGTAAGEGIENGAGGMQLDAGLLLGNLAVQAFFVGVVILLLFWRMNLVTTWGIRWRGWPWLFLYVPMVLILVYGLNAVLFAAGYLEWIAELTGNNPDEPTQESVKLLQESNDPLTLGLMALVACAGAPIMEEVVFRGYIYAAVKRLSNIPVAVVFSGLLFGAVHLDLAAFLPLTVLGILLALVYERTGSLWMPLAVHFAFNSITVAIQMLNKLRPEWFEEAEQNAAFIGIW